MRLFELLSYPRRMFYGWRMVAIGLIINAVGGGIFNQGFAVFFLPISRDLDLTRAQASLIFSLSRAEGAIEGPISGWLVDKFGPKYILFGGALLAGIGYVVLSQMDSYAMFLLVYLGLISVAVNAGFSHPVMSVANAWFIRKRGLAFSISLSSFSLGGIIFAPLLSYLVVQYGWRTTVIFAAGVLWAVVLPLSLKLVRSPESMGLRPDGDTDATVGARRNVTASGHDFTLKQALRTSAFWWLAVSTTLRLAVINTMNVHFIPILVWKGLSEIEAAFTLSAMATLSLTARLTMGVVGDRFPKQRVIAVFMLLGIVGLLTLQHATQTWQIGFYVLTYATMEGIIPLNWALIGDFFGRSHFATLRGVMGLVYTWGAVIFPVLGGWIFDSTQSYAMMIWILIGLFVVGSLAFALLKPPRPPIAVSPVPARV